MMRKICIITGTRAEWGLLSSLARLIKDDSKLELQIIATNMHLSPEFGLTYHEIRDEGFKINKKVEMLLASDTANATSKSVGLATIGFADAYEDLQPDLIIILGDRYEMLAAATAALFYRIPIAHIAGGEITQGAYDESIRHSITKMSHLHFTATNEYRNRVIQLGEQPNHVFNVGAIGIDNIKNTRLLSKRELEDSIAFDLGEKSFLITYHPVTLSSSSPEERCGNLLRALENYPDYKMVFTYPNSDTDGRVIIKLINEFCMLHPKQTIAVTSLGKIRYLSALQYVSAVIGNSSSGVVEVPSFHIPTLDIGQRQQGRLASDSVVHCGTTYDEIAYGLQEVVSSDVKKRAKTASNPYEQPDTANNIYKIIKDFPLDNLIMKPFYDLKQ